MSGSHRAWNTNAAPAAREAWLDDMFLPPDKMVLPLNEVVVRSGGQTILIDAGLGVDYVDFAPRAGWWSLRLEAAGIDLTSVTDVVLTHMHSTFSPPAWEEGSDWGGLVRLS